MSVEIFDLSFDSVIDSSVSLGRSSYEFALENLYPLINRFEAQRKPQDKKFYRRLERDIVDGCLMPPLTIAFVGKPEDLKSKEKINAFVNKNITQGFILDGIQRLHTLKRASEKEGFNPQGTIYLNIIIAPNEDKLLYRMITLNNGQKPMTPRHQIEILTQELFDFSQIDLDIQTEKERSKKAIKDAFSVADISKAYLAFLTDEVNNENNKIIGDKMDEIIVRRIMEHKPQSYGVDFIKILELISKLSRSDINKKWLKTTNNLIGFAVGVKTSYESIDSLTLEDFEEATELFESEFKNINPSKVNLGRYRRELSREFIEKFPKLSELDNSELLEHFSNITS